MERISVNGQPRLLSYRVDPAETTPPRTPADRQVRPTHSQEAVYGQKAGAARERRLPNQTNQPKIKSACQGAGCIPGRPLMFIWLKARSTR